MDPISALLGPWAQLGVVGTVVIALALDRRSLWTRIKELTEKGDRAADRHLADVKDCAEKNAQIVSENTKAYAALASAIERMGDKLR